MRFDTRHGWRQGGQKMMKMWKNYEVFRINKKCFWNTFEMILNCLEVILVLGQSSVDCGSVGQSVVGLSLINSRLLFVNCRSVVSRLSFRLVFNCWLCLCRSLVGRRSSCSTSLPGGDQVDGLPPAASNSGTRRIGRSVLSATMCKKLEVFRNFA